MKINSMSEYFYLTREIEKQQVRLENLRTEPFGASLGPGLPRCKDAKEIEKYIKNIEAAISASIEKALSARTRISQYIDSIEDPRLREVMRDRFIEGMQWASVGESNFMAPDHARKIVREHFSSR